MQNPDLGGPTTHPQGAVLIKWLGLPRGMLAKHSCWVLFAVAVYTSASNITQRALVLIQYCSKADLGVWFKKHIAYDISQFSKPYCSFEPDQQRTRVWTPWLWLFPGSYPLLVALGLLSLADTEDCDKDKIPEKLLLDQLKDSLESHLELPSSWLQCHPFHYCTMPPRIQMSVSKNMYICRWSYITLQPLDHLCFSSEPTF